MNSAGFLRAILDDPDDDTHRLVYADWLEDRGEDTRAEFIRDQVLNRPGSLDYDLLDVHLEAWCPWFQRHDELGFERDHQHNTNGLRVRHLGGETTYWRRGFLEEVHLSSESFLTHADALTACTPLREARLTTRPEVHDFIDEYQRRDIPPSCRTERTVWECLRSFWPRVTFTLPPLLTDATWEPQYTWRE